MNKNKTYIFHSDAGHAWLAVRRKELMELGIMDKVSIGSYERGVTVYLEEDCDAGLFIKALKSKGIDIKYRESVHPTQSPIRKYNHFKLRHKRILSETKK
jgi:hypothetical protein